MKTKWDKKLVFKESKKYTSRIDFQKGCRGAYRKACSENWLDEMYWLMSRQKPSGYWNNKENVFKESKKYTSRQDFAKGCSRAYEKSLTENWIDEMTWLKQKPSGYWTKEKIFEESKKYTYYSDFQKGCHGAYVKALKNNWLYEMTWLSKKYKPDGYWTKEQIFEASKLCISRRDFGKKYRRAYFISLKNGWLDEMTWLVSKQKPCGYWNEENVFEVSKLCTTRSEFQKKYKSAYAKALQNGWLDEMIWLKPKKSSYLFCVYVYVDEENKVAYVGLTKDKERRHMEHKTGFFGGVKKESAVFKYFNELNKDVPEPIYLEENMLSDAAKIKEDEWRKVYESKGYNMLNKAKTGLFSSSIGGSSKWTKTKIFEESKKYNSRGDFQKGCTRAYMISLKNGWLDEMFWLLPKRIKWTKEKVFEVYKQYKNKSEFIRKCLGAYNYAKQNGFINELKW